MTLIVKAIGLAMTITEIRFHHQDRPYGELSNFAPYPIEVDGERWSTSEHYFQAMKFAGQPELMAKLRAAPTPGDAARMGRNLTPIRADWDDVKEAVMLTALRAKFRQHPKPRRRLLQTGDALLIEHTPRDSYWADGGDGSGRNRLGALLMQVRAELAAEHPLSRDA